MWEQKILHSLKIGCAVLACVIFILVLAVVYSPVPHKNSTFDCKQRIKTIEKKIGEIKIHYKIKKGLKE